MRNIVIMNLIEQLQQIQQIFLSLFILFLELLTFLCMLFYLYIQFINFKNVIICVTISFLFKRIQHTTIIIHLFFYLMISILLYLWTTLILIQMSLKQITRDNISQKILIRELIDFFSRIKKFLMISFPEKLSMDLWNNNLELSTKL